MNKKLFFIFSLVFGLAPLIGEFSLFLTQGHLNPTFWAALVIGIVLVSNLFFFKIHKNYEVAKLILCVTLILLTSFAISKNGGITSPLWYFMFAVIFVCSYFLGKKGSIFVTLYSLVFVIILYFQSDSRSIIQTQKLSSLVISFLSLGVLSILYENEKELSTEREKKLNILADELEEFSYIAAHDLRGPLRSITNLTSWIIEDYRDQLPKDVYTDLEIVSSKSQLMDDMVEGLLEYTLIKNSFKKASSFELTEMVEEVLSLIDKPSSYTINYSKTLRSIKTYRQPLLIVLRNLIENSVKYRSKDSGKVDIKILKKRDFYKFSVIDDGPGIAPQYHDKVFRLFHSLGSEESDKTSGVGLSLVKKNIERVGGKVWIETNSGTPGLNISFLWPIL